MVLNITLEMTENDQNYQNGHRKSTVSHFNGLDLSDIYFWPSRERKRSVICDANQGNLDKLGGGDEDGL
jgi:hypothetical protein